MVGIGRSVGVAVTVDNATCEGVWLGTEVSVRLGVAVAVLEERIMLGVGEGDTLGALPISSKVRYVATTMPKTDRIKLRMGKTERMG